MLMVLHVVGMVWLESSAAGPELHPACTVLLCQNYAHWMLVTQTHGACTESQAAAVIYEVLKVIATCHAEGLLHGDIKPGLLAPRIL